MKTYEAPKLIAISLTGNEQLCGTCADKGAHLLKDDLSFAQFLMEFFGIADKGNPGPDRNDFVGVFGESESQCTTRQIDSYCKFTSTGSALVAWS